MKSRSEIKAWLHQLIQEELARRLQEAQTRLPHVCVHHHDQPLDYRKHVDGLLNPAYNRISSGRSLPVMQTIGLCMLNSESSEDWRGDICEDPEDALRCPYFQARETREEVVAKLASSLEHNPSDVSTEIAVLCTVLDDQAVLWVPWWLRWWYWLRGWKIQDMEGPPRPVGELSRGVVYHALNDSRTPLDPREGAEED